jgi:hypothetical protein
MCLNRGGGPQGLDLPAHPVFVGYQPGGLPQAGHPINHGFIGIPPTIFQHHEVQWHPFQNKGLGKYFSGHFAAHDLTAQLPVALSRGLIHGFLVSPTFESNYEVYIIAYKILKPICSDIFAISDQHTVR